MPGRTGARLRAARGAVGALACAAALALAGDAAKAQDWPTAVDAASTMIMASPPRPIPREADRVVASEILRFRRIATASVLERVDARPPVLQASMISAPRAEPPAAAPRADDLLSPEALDAALAPPPPDPMMMVVSLKDQRMHVYRGAERIHETRVSTGKRGHRTPVGAYSILQKRRRHHSNLYSNAPMPYMQRITWSGLALHEGRVPRRPASHGCIRLPRGFARKIFKETSLGEDVFVVRSMDAPRGFQHVSLFQPRPTPFYLTAGRLPQERLAEPADTRWTDALDIDLDADALADVESRTDDKIRMVVTFRKDRSTVREAQRLLAALDYDVGPVDGALGRMTAGAIKAFQADQGLPKTGALTDELIERLYAVSGRERVHGHLYVRRGFEDLFDAPVRILEPEKPLGTHVFTAMGFRPSDWLTEWTVLTLDQLSDEERPEVSLDRILIPPEARARIERILTPGSSLIVTDAGLGWETGKGTGFVIQPKRRRKQS